MYDMPRVLGADPEAVSGFDDLSALLAIYLIGRRVPVRDAAAIVPELVEASERHFNASLRTVYQHADAVLDLDADGCAVLPLDYAGFRDAYVLGGVQFQPLRAGLMGGPPLGGSRPVLSIDGDLLRLRQDMRGKAILLAYTATIPPLSDESPQNWLMEKLPFLYIGRCLEAAAACCDDYAGVLYFRALADAQLAFLRADAPAPPLLNPICDLDGAAVH